MLIAHLNLISPPVDIDELSERLAKMKLDWKMSNNIGFCPHLICLQNPDDDSIYIDNTNDGHLSGLRKRNIVIDCSDIGEFLTRVSDFTGKYSVSRVKRPNVVENYGNVHEENGINVLF